MRIKVVPEPPKALDDVETVRQAVPLVPGGVADCCDRLVREADVSSRNDARRWLTLLTRLGFVDERAGGYVRTRVDLDRSTLANRFREGVFGAEEAIAVLERADEPQTADAIFAALEAHIPQWERHRDPGGWEETWRHRIESLLDWFVLLDLAERVDGGYRRLEGAPESSARNR